MLLTEASSSFVDGVVVDHLQDFLVVVVVDDDEGREQRILLERDRRRDDIGRWYDLDRS